MQSGVMNSNRLYTCVRVPIYEWCSALIQWYSFNWRQAKKSFFKTCASKQLKIISRSILTLLGFFSLGGGMSRILLIAWRGGSLKNGGSPSIISITIIPRDHMSTYKDHPVENKHWKFKEKIPYTSIHAHIPKYKHQKMYLYYSKKRTHFEIVFNNAADILTSGP